MKTSLHTYLTEILGEALIQTLYMIIVPTIVATILGFIKIGRASCRERVCKQV